MPSTYKIIYTPEAREDLRQITVGILEVAWPQSAEKWLTKILNKAESLSLFPEGRPVYEYDSRYHSVKIGKYRIIYEVHKREQLVSILRIVYARRNLKILAIK